MLKKSFISLFLISSFAFGVLNAAELIFPDPVVPELTPEEQKMAEVSLQSRREVAKKILRTYTETYNSEFRSKNKVSINPIHPDTLAQVLKSVDLATEAQLIDGRLTTMQALKKQYDDFAVKTYDLAKKETVNQIKFLGLTMGEITTLKQKHVEAETKNLELTTKVTALQAEVVELKNTIGILQEQSKSNTAAVSSTPVVQQQTIVEAVPAAQQRAAMTTAAATKSGMTKIVVLVLLGLAVAFIILKSRSN